MAERVLITGGAGFLGSHLVEQLLKSNYEITVLDDMSRGNKNIFKKVDYVKADLTSNLIVDEISDRQFDFVIHLASLAYVEESTLKPELYFSSNINGIINALSVCIASRSKRFIFTSSMAVYGNLSFVVNERTLCNPINPYGKSKLICEAILDLISKSAGLGAVTLRLPNLAGVGENSELLETHFPETHIIPNILNEALRAHKDATYSDSKLEIFGELANGNYKTCTRDFLHVQDVCSAIELAMNRLATSPHHGHQVFNLSSDNYLSIMELLEIARKVTNQPIHFTMKPTRTGDPFFLYGDSSLFRNETGWLPSRSDPLEMLSRVWQTMLSKS
jgi:UDP-glucose 4-epimerase